MTPDRRATPRPRVGRRAPALESPLHPVTQRSAACLRPAVRLKHPAAVVVLGALKAVRLKPLAAAVVVLVALKNAVVINAALFLFFNVLMLFLGQWDASVPWPLFTVFFTLLPVSALVVAFNGYYTDRKQAKKEEDRKVAAAAAANNPEETPPTERDEVGGNRDS